MATATETRDYFTKLYLAAFLRAPETSGLNYWSNKVLVEGDSLQEVGGVIFSLPTVTTLYPVFLTSTQFVEQIYQNVFDRTSDAEGSAYWTAELNTLITQFTNQGSAQPLFDARAQLTLNMINAGIGAVGADGHDYIMNRMAVASYTIDAQIASGNEISPAQLAAIMATVNADPATVTAAMMAVDAAAAGGEAFYLTSGVDGLPDYLGTIHDDTYYATNSTLTAGDDLDGAAGIDTLRLAANLGLDQTLAAFDITNIEIFDVTADGIGTLTVEMSGVTGVDNLVTRNSSADVSFTQVAEISNITLDTLTGAPDISVEFQDSVLGGVADALNVDIINTPMVNFNITDVSGGFVDLEDLTLNVHNAGETEVNVNSELADSLERLYITGENFIDIWDTFTNVSLIDASATTGGVEIEAEDTDVTMLGGSGNDDIRKEGFGDATIQSNDGDDYVEVLVDSGTSTTIDMGAGIDRLNASIQSNSSLLSEGGAGDDSSSIFADNGSFATAIDSSGDDIVFMGMGDNSTAFVSDTSGNDDVDVYVGNNSSVQVDDLAGNNDVYVIAGSGSDVGVHLGAGDDAIRVDAGDNSGVNVSTGNGENAVNLDMGSTVGNLGTATVTGGTGRDVVYLNAGAASVVFNVNLGAGDTDYLNAFDAVLSANDSVDGGDGINDRIYDQQAGLEAATVNGFEQVDVADTLTGNTFDAEHFTGEAAPIAFTLYGGHADGATIQNLSIGQTLNVVNEDEAGDVLNLDDEAFINADDHFALRQSYSSDLSVNFLFNAVEILDMSAYDNNHNRLHIENTGLQTLNLEASAGSDGLDYIVSTGETDLTVVNAAASTFDLDLQDVNYEGATTGVAGSATAALTLTTGSGDDTVFGGMNNDTIMTNAGDDILWGALGWDSLTGGSGADRFVYRSVAESGDGVNAGQGDRIVDFTSYSVDPMVHDQLDMSFLLLEAFAGNRADFALAQGALLGGGNVSAVFQQDAHRLWVDVDGNGTLDANDLRIEMMGVTSLAPEDFVYGFVFEAPGTTIVGTLFDDAFFSTEANFVGSTAVGGLGDDTVYITDNTTVALNIAASQLNSIENLVLQAGSGMGGFATTVAGADLDIIAEAGANVVMNDVGQSFMGMADADTVVGSGNADLIDVDAGDNTVNAGSGNDTVMANGGNDTLNGDDGDDSIEAGDGANSVTGGIGMDTITTGTGDDTISAGADADTIEAGDGDNLVDGEAGADLITTGADNDTINGGSENDTITSNEGADQVDGGDGDDSITTGAGQDNVFGGNGNDTVFAQGGADYVDGWEGNDSLEGGGGDDTIYGWNGDDTIDGGNGADSIQAEAGNDSVQYDAADVLTDGGTETDTLEGTSAADTIVQDGIVVLNYENIMGMEDNDILTNATGGTVTLDGGEGNDQLNETMMNATMAMLGGAGDDTVNMFAMTVADTVNGGDDYDVLNFTDSNGVDNDLDNVTNIERINLGDAITFITTVDTLVAAGATLEVNATALTGGNALFWNGEPELDGNFSILSVAGNDIIVTGRGNDFIQAGDGNNSVAGHTGTDTIIAGTGNDFIFGDEDFAPDSVLDGNDSISAGDGNNLVYGQGGDDSINAGSGDDSIDGGSGNDRISFGAGNDAVLGSDGNDSIIGGSNVTTADTIDGGVGDDTLSMTDANGAGTDLDNTTNIEHLILGDAATFVLTQDALVAAGATLEVDATALTGANNLFWNSTFETDGMFSVLGSSQADSIFTGDMGDTVKAGNGNDFVVTGLGADSLEGGAGNDFLNAGFGLVGDGNNFLDGGAGADFLAGGDAQDTFFFGIGETGTTDPTADSVAGFDGLEDTLQFEGGAAGSGTNYFENGVVAADYAAALAAANLDFTNVPALNYVVVEVTSFTGGGANDLVLFYNGGAGNADSSVILEDIPLTGIGFADIAAG